MKKEKVSFASVMVDHRRVQLLATDKAFYDAEIKVERVPITGGFNIDPKIVRFERATK